MRFSIPKNFVVGLLGGLIGVFLFFSILSSYPDSRLGAYLISNLRLDSESITIKKEPSPTPTSSIAPNFWEYIISEASLSSVAVQVFKENQIIRSGSGVILSSDGLVVIPADLTSLGGIYQVLYGDKISKGVVVAYDLRTNLAIIKITNSNFDLNVSDLESNFKYQSGQDMLITGKLVELSKTTVVSQKGIISYVSGGNINLDTLPNPLLIGAKVINSEGRLVGIMSLRMGKANIISSKDIEVFLTAYINKTK